MSAGKRRRGKGEGSIHRRPNGLWVGTIELPSTEGRRHRKVVYARTRAELVGRGDVRAADQR